MTWLIPSLQALAGMLWLVVVVQRLPGLWRIRKEKGRVLDVYGFPLPFNGLVQVGFTVRWFVWPKAIVVMALDELMFWAGLYLASAGIAGLYVVMFYYRPKA